MIHGNHRGSFAASLLVGAGVLILSLAAPAADNDNAGSGSICSQKAYAVALRYQQKSAEVAALQRQAYALARMRLKAQLAAHNAEDHLAVVTDLDETAIDNTPLLVRDMRACHDYTQWDTWSHWEQDGHPKLIPGAKRFFDYANEHGVSIYYVSDRFKQNKQDTIDTLKQLGLPQVSDDTVLLYGTPKTERRASVRADHTVVLLLGDSLADFSGIFDDKSVANQRALVKEHADEFGDKWIVLPNSAYGDWSDAKLDGWDAPMQIDQ